MGLSTRLARQCVSSAQTEAAAFFFLRFREWTPPLVPLAKTWRKPGVNSPGLGWDGRATVQFSRAELIARGSSGFKTLLLGLPIFLLSPRPSGSLSETLEPIRGATYTYLCLWDMGNPNPLSSWQRGRKGIMKRCVRRAGDSMV